MAILYFDSSALIKRYIKETGTAWVLSLLSAKAGNDVYVARIASVEVVSAITRRARGGSLTVAFRDAGVCVKFLRRMYYKTGGCLFLASFTRLSRRVSRPATFSAGDDRHESY